MKKDNSNVTWWESFEFPRYSKFHPDEMLHVHYSKIALIKILCRKCGKEFQIGIGSEFFNDENFSIGNIEKLKYFISDELYPPFHLNSHEGKDGLICTGCIMRIEYVKILEFWERKDKKWILQFNNNFQEKKI